METTLDTPDTTAVGNAEITLWNPTAAALWSLLLSPALGAYLLMRNWEQLGEAAQARRARFWFAGTLAITLAGYLAAAAAVLLERPELAAPWWSGLVIFAVWVVLSAYPHISHVDDHHGEGYARRGWLGPLLIALAANCAIPFVAGLVVGLRSVSAAAGA